MISMYSGTIGSGKTYHAIEDIVEALSKGKYVIANFPLKFSPGQINRGWADRFMYVDDRYLMGRSGIKLLLETSRAYGWDVSEKEGECLVVLDEVTNYFPKEDASKPEQRLWRTFFTQTRKLGYDFILILQDENSINKTIKKCVEYDVKHRKANNIFPFKLLSIFRITIFFYVTYWCQQRTRIKSSSSIFVKRLSKMYDTKKMFFDLDAQLDLGDQEDVAKYFPAHFGNCKPRIKEEAPESGSEGRRGPFGEVPALAPDVGDAHETEKIQLQ